MNVEQVVSGHARKWVTVGLELSKEDTLLPQRWPDGDIAAAWRAGNPAGTRETVRVLGELAKELQLPVGRSRRARTETRFVRR